MNKWLGIARLTKDPEIRYTQDGNHTIAHFSIAVDIGRDKTSFFNVSAWDKTAEFADKYLKKGMKIGIEGSLRADEYTNRDGNKATSVYILADRFEFCEKKEQTAPQQPTAEEKAEWAEVGNTDDEQLPFNF